MTTMLERMARAMERVAEYDGADHGSDCPGNDRVVNWPTAARAALLTIRDLDSGDINDGGLSALVAGKTALYSCSEDPELQDARGCFHAMIDAILNEPAGSTRTRSISEVRRADLVAHIPKSIAPEPPQTGARTRVAEGAATWEYTIRSVTDEGDCWRIEGEPENSP